MKLDDVIHALGLQNGAALARELGLTKGAIHHWRRTGIPAHRRFQLAEILEKRGRPIPAGLLDPHQVRKRAA